MDNIVPIDDDMDEQDYYNYNEVYTVIVPVLDGTTRYYSKVRHGR